MDQCHVEINNNYREELKENFENIEFDDIEKQGDMFVTNSENVNMANDLRIFRETNIKKIFFTLFRSIEIKLKLSYFSQRENTDDSKIYKFDQAQELNSSQTYAIHNIGHATQLIQTKNFNILTDPIFGDISGIFCPEKTRSHPSIDNLPKIDVILISHNHRDHLDERSLKTLLKYYKKQDWQQPKIFVPLGDKKFLESLGFSNVEEVGWFTNITVTKSLHTVNFVSIPADHRSGRFGFDHHKSSVNGWIMNPRNDNVIFKYSGDTRSLTLKKQKAVDAVLWNEIKSKSEFPDVICFEPSGPNYTRQDMDVTHQSTSYSALLKFLEAKNLAELSGRDSDMILPKIYTVMMHHNKFQLGPDRFNEGLFVFKKLLIYLGLHEQELTVELARQEEKLEKNADKKRLLKAGSLFFRCPISFLPKQTSLLIRSKSFIIHDINKFKQYNIKKNYLYNYLLTNTIFPKIGERLNGKEIHCSKFDLESIHKYNNTQFLNKK